ncbi:DUF3048 C-terminal domain-containing protein, partial [Candidatus Uhrbacteria bacterium]|nr:DUF3048 C-terminal domain-containing protein [Candidatus Uhrbacteria bacterium]
QGAIRRDATRPAPHNAYTSVYELYDAMTAKNEDWLSRDISYGVWSFDEKPPEGAVSASSLTVDFSASVNQVIWRYDETAGGWIRAQGGKDAITADGKTISASNVAVVITDISILDAVGRRKIRTIGEGEGYVLRDGMKIDATWKKPSTKERLRFYDQAGKEIPMKPGATWIEVVGGEGQVTIK